MTEAGWFFLHDAICAAADTPKTEKALFTLPGPAIPVSLPVVIEFALSPVGLVLLGAGAAVLAYEWTHPAQPPAENPEHPPVVRPHGTPDAPDKARYMPEPHIRFGTDAKRPATQGDPAPPGVVPLAPSPDTDSTVAVAQDDKKDDSAPPARSEDSNADAKNAAGDKPASADDSTPPAEDSWKARHAAALARARPHEPGDLTIDQMVDVIFESVKASLVLDKSPSRVEREDYRLEAQVQYARGIRSADKLIDIYGPSDPRSHMGMWDYPGRKPAYSQAQAREVHAELRSRFADTAPAATDATKTPPAEKVAIQTSLSEEIKERMAAKLAAALAKARPEQVGDLTLEQMLDVLFASVQASLELKGHPGPSEREEYRHEAKSEWAYGNRSADQLIRIYGPKDPSIPELTFDGKLEKPPYSTEDFLAARSRLDERFTEKLHATKIESVATAVKKYLTFPYVSPNGVRHETAWSLAVEMFKHGVKTPAQVNELARTGRVRTPDEIAEEARKKNLN